MTRFFSKIFITILLTHTLSACVEPDDRNAFLSSLILSAGELTPEFDPRTKTYSAHVSCAHASIDIKAPAAYPGLDVLIVQATNPEEPTIVAIELGVDNIIDIDLSGDSFIPTSYMLTVTRGGEFDPPDITITGDINTIATLNVQYADQGATACDGLGGDISSNVISSDTTKVDYTALGIYFVTYNVEDANGVAALPALRTVTVVENTAPVITLLGNATETVAQNSDYNDAGATAADAQEGDITDKIVDNADLINTTVTGTQTITYMVTDSGNLSASPIIRSVIVE